MTTGNHANGSGAPDDSGGGGAQTGSNLPETDGGDKPDKVPYATYSRAIADVKRWKAQAEEAAKQVAAFEAQQKEAEREKLEKQGEWQKLAESSKQEAEDWKAKYESLNSKIVESKKAHAIASRLPGTLRPEYFHMLDTEAVAYNPDTGEIDETSAVKAAEVFAKKFPELIASKPSSNLPNHEPVGGKGGLTYAEWKKLSYAEKKARFNEVTDF